MKGTKLLLIFIFLITAALGATAVFIGYRISQEEEVTPERTEAAGEGVCFTGGREDWMCTGSGCCAIYCAPNAGCSTDNYCNPLTAPVCSELITMWWQDVTCSPGQMALCNNGVQCVDPASYDCVLPCTITCPPGTEEVPPVGGECPEGSTQVDGVCAGCDNPYPGCCQAPAGEVGCNSGNCNSDNDVCIAVDSRYRCYAQYGDRCRNSECPDETDCVCEDEPPPEDYCGDSCTGTTCDDDTTCHNGTCCNDCGGGEWSCNPDVNCGCPGSLGGRVLCHDDSGTYAVVGATVHLQWSTGSDLSTDSTTNSNGNWSTDNFQLANAQVYIRSTGLDNGTLRDLSTGATSEIPESMLTSTVTLAGNDCADGASTPCGGSSPCCTSSFSCSDGGDSNSPWRYYSGCWVGEPETNLGTYDFTFADCAAAAEEDLSCDDLLADGSGTISVQSGQSASADLETEYSGTFSASEITFEYDAEYGTATGSTATDGSWSMTATETGALAADTYEDAIWVTITADTFTSGGVGTVCAVDLIISEEEVEEEPEEPTFEAEKTATIECINNDTAARIDYTITVTNTSDVSGTVYSVQDTYDSRIQSSWVSNIDPTPDSHTGNIITWNNNGNGWELDGGESLEFSYTVTVPSAYFGAYENGTFVPNIYENFVLVRTEEGDIELSEEVEIICLPPTGIMDHAISAVLMALLLILVGTIGLRNQNSIAYALNIGHKIWPFRMIIENLTLSEKERFEKKTLKKVDKKKR